MLNKIASLLCLSILTSGCYSNNLLNNPAQPSYTQYPSAPLNQAFEPTIPHTTKVIKIGEDVGFDYLQRLATSTIKPKKVYPIECGELFYGTEDGFENELEDAYQFANMEVRIAGNRVAIMKVIGLPENTSVEYRGLRIDKDFDPSILDQRKFDIVKSNDSNAKNEVSIENTQYKALYDEKYIFYNTDIVESLYLYYSKGQVVAVEVFVPC